MGRLLHVFKFKLCYSWYVMRKTSVPAGRLWSYSEPQMWGTLGQHLQSSPLAAKEPTAMLPAPACSCRNHTWSPGEGLFWVDFGGQRRRVEDGKAAQDWWQGWWRQTVRLVQLWVTSVLLITEYGNAGQKVQNSPEKNLLVCLKMVL